MEKVILNGGHVKTDDRGFSGSETEGGNNDKTIDLIADFLSDYVVEVHIVDQDNKVPFDKLGSMYPNATLFYSHHTNSFNGQVGGVEVFYGYGRTLAQNIATRTAAILESTTRGADNGAKNNAIEGFLSVIRQAQKAGVKYQMLGEIGFHDNPKEVKLIVERRPQIAKAIGEEIVKYLKLEKKPAPVEVKKDLAPDGKLFQVVIGAYKDRANANAEMTKAKAAGLDPYLVIITDPKLK